MLLQMSVSKILAQLKMSFMDSPLEGFIIKVIRQSLGCPRAGGSLLFTDI